MAQHHGGSSGSALGRLLPIVGVGFVVWLLVTVLVTEFVPGGRTWAPAIGLLVALLLLRHPGVMARLRALGRGVADELTVAADLAALPPGWRTFHDVRTTSGTIDHVVVSNRGVFALHVVRSGGRVVVLGDQIVRNGRPQDEMLVRMDERGAELAAHLGVSVRTVLVVAGSDTGDHDLGSLLVTSAERLPGLLAAQPGAALDLHEGRRVMAELHALVRGGRRQNGTRAPEPARHEADAPHAARGTSPGLDPRLRSTAT